METKYFKNYIGCDVDAIDVTIPAINYDAALQILAIGVSESVAHLVCLFVVLS